MWSHSWTYYWNGDYSDLDKCFNYFGVSEMTQIIDGPGLPVP